MRHPPNMTNPWRTGDATAQLLVDLAAGRPTSSVGAITEDELALAARHGLLGLMAHSDNEALHSAATPYYARLVARQKIMEGNTRRLLGALRDAGVDAAILKGPALARWAYSDPALRTYTDIDLLVHPGDVEESLDVLANDVAIQAIPIKTPKADKRNIIVRDPSGVTFTVDLHWDLFSYTQLGGTAAGATDFAWKAARQVIDETLGPMAHLPAEAMIAFLCTHAILDHRFRLILFRDLAEVARQAVNWEHVVRFAHDWQLRSTTYAALLMASHIADAPIPAETLTELRSGSLSMRATEYMLPKVDIVRFDGHHPHPLNLAIVVLHDKPWRRLGLAMRAPFAFPGWRKRLQKDPRNRTTQMESNQRRFRPIGKADDQGLTSTGQPRTRIIYIAGSNRSGSTLLDRMLGQMPGFASLGELANIWAQGVAGHRLCGCGAAFADCSFWQAVGQEAFGGWKKVNLEEVRQLERSVQRLRYLPVLAFPKSWPPFYRRLETYAGYLSNLYGAIASVSGCQVIIDSSKSPAYGILLRHVDGLDTSFVHLVRDSRGVAYSWTKRIQRADAPGSLMPRYGVIRSSVMWVVSNMAIEIAAVLGVPVKRIRYEDLVTNPTDTLREMLAVSSRPAKLEHLRFIREHQASMDAAHTVDGNPMRLQTGPVSIHLDSTWEKSLPRRERSLVSWLTLPLLRRYGYPLHAGGSMKSRSSSGP